MLFICYRVESDEICLSQSLHISSNLPILSNSQSERRKCRRRLGRLPLLHDLSSSCLIHVFGGSTIRNMGMTYDSSTGSVLLSYCKRLHDPTTTHMMSHAYIIGYHICPSHSTKIALIDEHGVTKRGRVLVSSTSTSILSKNTIHSPLVVSSVLTLSCQVRSSYTCTISAMVSQGKCRAS